MISGTGLIQFLEVEASKKWKYTNIAKNQRAIERYVRLKSYIDRINDKKLNMLDSLSKTFYKHNRRGSGSMSSSKAANDSKRTSALPLPNYNYSTQFDSIDELDEREERDGKFLNESQSSMDLQQKMQKSGQIGYQFLTRSRSQVRIRESLPKSLYSSIGFSKDLLLSTSAEGFLKSQMLEGVPEESVDYMTLSKKIWGKSKSSISPNFYKFNDPKKRFVSRKGQGHQRMIMKKKARSSSKGFVYQIR